MKYIAFLLCAFATIPLVSQDTAAVAGYDYIDEFKAGYAFVYLNGKMGMINSEGEEIIPPEYDHIDDFGKENQTWIYNNGLMGLINKEGQIIIPVKYNYLEIFVDGYKAYLNRREILIDRQGKVLTP